MTPELFVDIAARTLRVALLLAAPPLLIGLVVGVVISIFQSVMQIQEQTLVIVPKMIAILVIIFVLLPWMMQVLLDFTHNLFSHLPEFSR
jgi:flagellar biosynthesis protein FliQ